MNRRGFIKGVGAALVALMVMPSVSITPPNNAGLFANTGLAPGDVFTISGRYIVNPATQTADRRTLQQWLVTDVARGDWRQSARYLCGIV